jgi:trafficking kinesin-binding protein 1
MLRRAESTVSLNSPDTTRKRRSVDCSTLTDLHSSSAVSEVEVISLLDEELPRYRLKADYLTEFGGYSNNDFAGGSGFVIDTPCLKDPSAAVGLTPEQAEATLDYFVSSGDRLSQMTKTYHDVEAVTRLLEEKEKDLELAAKIGQELLERNRFLDDKVSHLETQVAQSTELITQLRHELHVKTDLLRAYSDDAQDGIGITSSEDASPLDGMRSINAELLQRKISALEKDNKKLHEEATELAKEAYEVEEKEEKLVHDTVKHLTEANVQISFLSEEFTVKSDESRKQKENITHLLAQVCDLTSRSKHFSRENDDLRGTVQVRTA